MEPALVRTGGWDRTWLAVYAGLFAVVVVVSLATDFDFWGTLAGVAGLFFLLLGLRSLRLAVSSRSVEQEAIGSLGGYAGAVEVEGTARPADGPVAAPLTGTESVAYRVEVARWKPSRDHSE